MSSGHQRCRVDILKRCLKDVNRWQIARKYDVILHRYDIHAIYQRHALRYHSDIIYLFCATWVALIAELIKSASGGKFQKLKEEDSSFYSQMFAYNV
jgi:hypothetical protein